MSSEGATKAAVKAAGKAKSVVESATKAVETVYSKGEVMKQMKVGDAMGNLTYWNGLVAIAIATLVVIFLYKSFLRQVYFQYKADEKEKDDADDEDEAPRGKPWSAAFHPPAFLTNPFGFGVAKKEADEEEEAEEEASPKKASPGSAKSRARSSSPKSASKKTR